MPQIKQEVQKTMHSPTSTLAKGKKVEQEIDNEVIYEFGGPIGVTAMMILFPLLMIYFWISVHFYQGTLSIDLLEDQVTLHSSYYLNNNNILKVNLYIHRV